MARRASRGPARRALEAFGIALLTLACFEIGLRGLDLLGWLPFPSPASASRGSEFWDPTHSDFGVWHAASSFARHQTDCFDVTYRTNEAGARDRSRALHSSASRVVVLGDSFVEGLGVEPEERFSDRLERDTGVEHLNFGMSHFSPYQSYLLYRALAKRYAHDAVLLGILPANDFFDLDYAAALRAPAYEYRYRPYLVAGPGGFARIDYRESPPLRWLRRHSFAYSAGSFLLGTREASAAPAEAPLLGSFYYEFPESQLALLMEVLRRFARETEAASARLAVVLLPSLHDLIRYGQSGPAPLAERLRELGSEVGFDVIDLLPGMYEQSHSPGGYFFQCDYHWNAHGHEVAAKLLRAQLDPLFYSRRP